METLPTNQASLSETALSVFLWSDPSVWITIAAILLLLVLSGFFSGAETALTASSRATLHNMADRGSRGAQRALRLTEDNEKLIGSVLLGNNLVNILSAALATALFTRLFGDSGVALATVVMTLLVLIFAEVLPKTYAISNAEYAAARVAAPITVLVRLLNPIVSVVRRLVRGLLRLIGSAPAEGPRYAEEEIAGVIALGHVEGGLVKHTKDRLMGALDLDERDVSEIMLHRSDIEMVDADLSPEEILSICLASPYTRLPLFRENQENIIGVVHAKDLLRAVDALSRDEKSRTEALKNFNILDVAMKPYFIPDTTTLDDQMREFLRRRSHFALVVDEYGDLQGLITLEDILEEIVGEISDEHDVTGANYTPADRDGNHLIDGGATIRDLNRAYEWSLPDEAANTIAGLVIQEAQMIPDIGQIFIFHGFRFEITGKEGNRITQIKLRPLHKKRNWSDE